MKSIFAAIILALSFVEAGANCDDSTRPKASKKSTELQLARTVFNRLSADTTQLDQALQSAYGCKYIFANVLDDTLVQKAKVLAGSMPGPQLDVGGNKLSGKVLIGYVITVEGLASDPIILSTTSPKLTAAALEAMKGWRFEPAKVNGRIVASLAAQEFFF